MIEGHSSASVEHPNSRCWAKEGLTVSFTQRFAHSFSSSKEPDPNSLKRSVQFISKILQLSA